MIPQTKLIILCLCAIVMTSIATWGIAKSLYDNDNNTPVDNDVSHEDKLNINLKTHDNSLLDLFTPNEINFDGFKTFEDCFGIDEQINKLKEIVQLFHPDTSENFKLLKNPKYKDRCCVEDEYTSTNDLPKGIIFFGPPGTGKTYSAKCFAKESQMNFYIITPAHSLQEIEDIFKKARKNSPAIVFADEAEEIVKTRDGSVHLEEGDAKKTNLFLAELDGVKTDKDKPIYFIASTNHIDKVDAAIISRLEKLYFGYFTPEQRKNYVKKTAKNYNIDPGAFDSLDQLMDEFNSALTKSFEYAVEITDNKRFIPAIGKNEDKQGLETLDDFKTQQDFINKYKDLLEQTIDGTTNSQKIKDKYKESKQQFLFLKNLDKIKKHFYDIQSPRKLEMFINMAANKAGLRVGKRENNKIILKSDLELALADYIGYRK